MPEMSFNLSNVIIAIRIRCIIFTIFLPLISGDIATIGSVRNIGPVLGHGLADVQPVVCAFGFIPVGIANLCLCFRRKFAVLSFMGSHC